MLIADESKQVTMEAYAVSNQGMALIRENMLVPTNLSRWAYVKDSSDEQYVPPVKYMVSAIQFFILSHKVICSHHTYLHSFNFHKVFPIC